MVATQVPGIDEEGKDILQPRKLYERQTRTEEYNQIVERLKTERREYMAKWDGLNRRSRKLSVRVVLDKFQQKREGDGQGVLAAVPGETITNVDVNDSRCPTTGERSRSRIGKRLIIKSSLWEEE